MSTDSSYFFFHFMCLPSAFTKTQGLPEGELNGVKGTMMSSGSRHSISCIGSLLLLLIEHLLYGKHCVRYFIIGVPI